MFDNDREYVEFDNSIEIGKLNFATPVVCEFRHEDDDPYTAFNEGIAYGKEVICLCCGSVIPLDELCYLAYYVDDVWPTFELFR